MTKPVNILRSFSELVLEVGGWAQTNFGNNVSQAVGPSHNAQLYSIGPMLGMVEEYGEFLTASEDANLDNEKDALADIGIYLCDFSRREGVINPQILWDTAHRFATKCHRIDVVQDMRTSFGDPVSMDNLIGRGLGLLSHAVLKHHQGIRGFNDIAFYFRERDKALLMILTGLIYETPHLISGLDYLNLINETWDKIVSKRDWKKSPESGDPDARRSAAGPCMPQGGGE